MKKLLSLIVILGLLVAGPIAIENNYAIAKDKSKKTEKVKKDKSQFNSCHQQCRDQHSEGIKKCIDWL